MPEVIHAAMIQLDPDQQPVAVWVTETYGGDDRTIEVLRTDDYTLWRYIVLVPKPLAHSLADWKEFLVLIARDLLPRIEGM